MYFVIKETLQNSNKKCIKNFNEKYVAVLTSKEWRNQKESFDFGIEIHNDGGN